MCGLAFGCGTGRDADMQTWSGNEDNVQEHITMDELIDSLPEGTDTFTYRGRRYMTGRATSFIN